MVRTITSSAPERRAIVSSSCSTRRRQPMIARARCVVAGNAQRPPLVGPVAPRHRLELLPPPPRSADDRSGALPGDVLALGGGVAVARGLLGRRDRGIDVEDP